MPIHAMPSSRHLKSQRWHRLNINQLIITIMCSRRDFGPEFTPKEYWMRARRCAVVIRAAALSGKLQRLFFALAFPFGLALLFFLAVFPFIGTSQQRRFSSTHPSPQLIKRSREGNKACARHAPFHHFSLVQHLTVYLRARARFKGLPAVSYRSDYYIPPARL